MKISIRHAWQALFVSLLLSPSAFAFNKAGNYSVTFGAGYDYFSSARYVKNAGIGLVN